MLISPNVILYQLTAPYTRRHRPHLWDGGEFPFPGIPTNNPAKFRYSGFLVFFSQRLRRVSGLSVTSTQPTLTRKLCLLRLRRNVQANQGGKLPSNVSVLKPSRKEKTYVTSVNVSIVNSRPLKRTWVFLSAKQNPHEAKILLLSYWWYRGC